MVTNPYQPSTVEAQPRGRQRKLILSYAVVLTAGICIGAIATAFWLDTRLQDMYGEEINELRHRISELEANR